VGVVGDRRTHYHFIDQRHADVVRNTVVDQYHNVLHIVIGHLFNSNTAEIALVARIEGLDQSSSCCYSVVPYIYRKDWLSFSGGIQRVVVRFLSQIPLHNQIFCIPCF